MANALPSLGFAPPAGLRIGRHVVLDLEAPTVDEAREQANRIAGTLLANPVIEDFVVHV